MTLAARMGRVAPSPTLKVAAEADRLRRAGVDVVDLGAGEPDFATPGHISAAAHAAIDAGFTKYTPSAGAADLREAVCHRYREDYGVAFTAAEVIATAGGKQALFNAAVALFEPGDEVITHTPFWPTIVDQIALLGATPVLVRTHRDDGFQVDADADRRPRHAAHQGDRPQLAGQPDRRADQRGHGGRHCRALRARRHLADRRSLLRAADLRTGAAQSRQGDHRSPSRPHGAVRLGVEGLRDDRLALRLGDRPGGVHRRLQHGAGPFDVERLVDRPEGGGGGADRPAGRRGRDARRVPRASRSHVWRGSRPTRGSNASGPAAPSTCSRTSPSCSARPASRTTAAFAERLLAEARVALTAGEAFDAPGFVRLSYATSLDRLREGVTRMHEFVHARERRPAATPAS